MYEIVTIGVGEQANHIGSHFWNTQESYFTYDSNDQTPSVNHDVNFRQGIAPDGSDTYLPRTLIYDYKDSFGTLRSDNGLYQLQDHAQASAEQWQGTVTTITTDEPRLSPSAYQAALSAGRTLPTLTTSSVRYWSDYSHTFYHPKSLIPIIPQDNLRQTTSSHPPITGFTSGVNLFEQLTSESDGQDLFERDLRPFLEDCDALQAIQIYTSSVTEGVWGGFTAQYVEKIRDEVGKLGIWVWGVDGPARSQAYTREQRAIQDANAIQTLCQLADTATLYLPLSKPQADLPKYITDFEAKSDWHTSALQSTSIESLTLPSRLQSDQTGRAKLDEFEATLTNGGQRRLAKLEMTISSEDFDPHANEVLKNHDDRAPTSTNGENQTIHSDQDNILQLDIDMTYHPTVTTSSRLLSKQPPHQEKIFSQVQSLRGSFLPSQDIGSINSSSHNRFLASGSINDTKLAVYQNQLLYPILSSFPSILTFDNKKIQPGKGRNVSIKSTLGTTSGMARDLRVMEEIARGSRVLLALNGMGDEREGICNDLARLREDYEDGWEGQESYNDDDD